MKKAKKPPKERKTKKPSEINKLDWTEFNFLENLLVFCVMRERSVEPENGVHFRISPRETDNSLCLLFETDRRGDPLLKNGGEQPDYMTFYAKANADFCLCTIIEMKGGKDIENAVKQIKNLKERLNKEIKANLPNKFKVKYQAIILHSPNNQTPDRQIARESTDEFVIRPVQVTQKAELFDFVSQKFTSTIPEINPQKQISNSRKNLFIEETLIHNALPKRKIGNFCKNNKHIANNKNGIYVNYSLSEEDYAALAVDDKRMKIGMKEFKEKSADKIKKDLTKLGLKTNQHFTIEKID